MSIEQIFDKACNETKEIPGVVLVASGPGKPSSSRLIILLVMCGYLLQPVASLSASGILIHVLYRRSNRIILQQLGGD
jgi:hypothetical protein